MLILRASHSNVGRGRLRILQRVLRLNDRNLVTHARVILRASIVKRLLVCRHGLVIERLQSVLSAQFKEVDSEAGLLRQPFILQVGKAYLRVVLVLADGVAHPAPKIRLPRDVERK